MTRANVFASLLAAAIAGSFSLQACARVATPAADKPAPAAAAQAAPARASAIPKNIGEWRLGTNYTLLETPHPPAVGPGKVEVVEVFWYGCGHCYALDPALESWKTGKPEFIEFVRVPVVWGPSHRQHAKLFYTIQALNRPDLHAKIFDAIHRGGKPLAAQTDEEARVIQMEFLKDQGVSEKSFNAAYDSMPVEANVQRARDLTEQFAVASVPLVIVNGKYETGVGPAGGAPQLLSLINDLAASEKGR
ncbi:MAG: thiol:disulfide interchange protein DsbA/DsbL [Pseudomonadota bacterium]